MRFSIEDFMDMARFYKRCYNIDISLTHDLPNGLYILEISREDKIKKIRKTEAQLESLRYFLGWLGIEVENFLEEDIDGVPQMFRL